MTCSRNSGCVSDASLESRLEILVTGRNESGRILLPNVRACVRRPHREDCFASDPRGLIHLPPDSAALPIEISSAGYLPKLIRLPNHDAAPASDYSVTLDADKRTTFILDEANALLESSGATSLLAGLDLPRNTPIDIAPIGPDVSGLIDHGYVIGGQHLEISAITAHAAAPRVRRGGWAKPTAPARAIRPWRTGGYGDAPAHRRASPARAPPVNLPQGSKGIAVFVPSGMLEGLSVEPASLALLYLQDGEWKEAPGELTRNPRYPWGETCSGCVGTNLFGPDGAYATGDENPALVPGPFPYVVSYRDAVPLKVSGSLVDLQRRAVASGLISLQGADGSGPAATSREDGSFDLTLLRLAGADDPFVLSISAPAFRPKSILLTADLATQSLPPTSLTPAPEALRTFTVTGPDGPVLAPPARPRMASPSRASAGPDGSPIADLPIRVSRPSPLVQVSIQNDALTLRFTQSPGRGWQASLAANGQVVETGDAPTLAARSTPITSEGLWRIDLTDAEGRPLSITELEILSDGPSSYVLSPDPLEQDTRILIPQADGIARESLPLGRCYVVEVQAKGLIAPPTSFCEETDIPIGLLEATPDVTYQEELLRPFFEAERCTGCHTGPVPAGGLDLTTLAGFLAGGQTGGIFSPDDPPSSRIVRYFLPVRRGALADALGRLAAQLAGEPLTVAPSVAFVGSHTLEVQDGQEPSLTAVVFPGTHPVTRVSWHVDDVEVATQEPASDQREFAFSPGRLDVGTHTIIVAVTDEAGAGAQDSVFVKVMPLALGPVTLTVEGPIGDIRDGTGPALTIDFIDQAAIASGASIHVRVEEGGAFLIDTDMPPTASPLVLALAPALGPHTYAVTATGASAETATATVAFNVLPAPAPSDFKATLSGTSCTVSWQAVTGALGYRVYWDTDGQAPYQGTGLPEGASPVSSTATSLTFTSLAEGVGYSFAAAAYTPIAEGEMTAAASVSYNLPPRITVTGLSSGEVLTAARTVTADVTDPNGVTSVDLTVDGALQKTWTSAPYTFSLDPTTFNTTSHTLVFSATEALGASSSTTLSFYTLLPPPPPPPGG
ncbi:MAG: hypothetical protein HYY13_04145, partial [Nitrospirae bacterium]|nr:hypothetical protein [Nitrospirota bacterium]